MDIFFSVLFILLGFLFINSFRKRLSQADIKTLRKLFVYHIIFGTYYCFFVQGDAIGHWRQAKLLTYEKFMYALTQEQGTFFIQAFNYIPAKILDLSYFTGTMMYSLLGFIGLTYFYILAKEQVPYNSKLKRYYLFPALFYLPNLHFWSCAVGKDTLLFFCIAIFMYGILNPTKRVVMIAVGLILAYLVRPHMALFILMAYGMAYFFTTKVSRVKRILFFFFIIGITIMILPSVMEFVKVEDTTVQSFDQFSQKKSGLLSGNKVGSAIDISAYPFPLKVFSFLYRPFFIDGTSIPAIIASFENLVLLILSIRVLRNKPLETFRKAPFVIQGMVYFLIIGVLAFSQSLGNIGIMIRMRNMFLPGLLIFMLWSFSYKQQQIAAKRKRK